MVADWLGIVAYKNSCAAVHARPSNSPSYLIQVKERFIWSVDLNDRPNSYSSLLETVENYVQEQSIDALILKAGTLGSDGRGRSSTLSSGELRGVIIAAAAKHCSVKLVDKGSISKMYGNRKIDEYVKDRFFWEQNVIGETCKFTREAAMFIIATNALFSLPFKTSCQAADRDTDCFRTS